MLSRWSFAFTRKGLEDVLRLFKEVLMTSLGRHLDDILKKARCDFDFRQVSIKTPLRHLCDVFVSDGKNLNVVGN